MCPVMFSFVRRGDYPLWASVAPQTAYMMSATLHTRIHTRIYTRIHACLTHGVHGDVNDHGARANPVTLHQSGASGRRDQDVRVTNLHDFYAIEWQERTFAVFNYQLRETNLRPGLEGRLFCVSHFSGGLVCAFVQDKCIFDVLGAVDRSSVEHYVCMVFYRWLSERWNHARATQHPPKATTGGVHYGWLSDVTAKMFCESTSQDDTGAPLKRLIDRRTVAHHAWFVCFSCSLVGPFLPCAPVWPCPCARRSALPLLRRG